MHGSTIKDMDSPPDRFPSEKHEDIRYNDAHLQLESIIGHLPYLERYYKLLEQARKELKEEGWSAQTDNLYKNKPENSSIAHDITS